MACSRGSSPWRCPDQCLTVWSRMACDATRPVPPCVQLRAESLCNALILLGGSDPYRRSQIPSKRLKLLDLSDPESRLVDEVHSQVLAAVHSPCTGGHPHAPESQLATPSRVPPLRVSRLAAES